MALYFVAIVPDSAVESEVRSFQKDFKRRFSAEKALKNFPHITIITPFHFNETNESEVVGNFLKMNLSEKPFEVVLDGFDCFANPHHPVIFIKPISENLPKLYKEVQKQMPFIYLENFNPHLTVAYRDLTQQNFDDAWTEYAEKEFKAKFNVDKISLYKHFDAKWNEIASKKLL
ncbi:2'-5' RNA ligase family protein [uncultured Chryseobacterium sp.]|uniref:2'-5' RNA ligase family protein n=1 Tax=uncultured Chryseobacterium sp. TaxID=259322 RepID=UPI002621FCE6|nr:2'-5' RNA ligase family protein [uncultured Chryseobacterium sp.]